MAVYDKDGNPVISPITKDPKKKGGKGPRQSGTRVEKLVARKLGGERTVGSGAFKNTNRNLEGDVEIYDDQKRAMVKLEVKMSGAVTASGEKSYTIKKSELQQMQREADNAKELGALVFHFKGESIENAWAVVSIKTLEKFIEDAKFARTSRL